MPFKININRKDGKTFKLEADTEAITGKKIGETIEGSDLKPELSGYKLEITGLSDIAGFPALKNIEGTALKKVLLTKGKAMRTSRPKGLRLKKTIRGNTISSKIVQVNTRVIEEGGKKLEEIFPEQNKPKEKPAEQPAVTQ